MVFALSLLALVTDPHHQPPQQVLPAVHGGFAAPNAWLALWHGEAWVCWDTGAPGCWQRLELAGIVDLATVRAEFVDRSTLVLADRTEGAWLIVRPDPAPRIAAWSTTPRHSPGSPACGSTGVLPIAGPTSPGLIACDAPPGDGACVRAGRPLRLRPASPLRLRLGVELRALDDWRLPALGASTGTGVQLLATLGVGLDAAWSSQRRERADLRAQARPVLRTLPAPRSRGPLAADERRALRAVVCGGVP